MYSMTLMSNLSILKIIDWTLKLIKDIYQRSYIVQNSEKNYKCYFLLKN